MKPLWSSRRGLVCGQPLLVFFEPREVMIQTTLGQLDFKKEETRKERNRHRHIDLSHLPEFSIIYLGTRENNDVE